MLYRMLPCALLALLAATLFVRAATIKMPANSDIAKRDLPKWDWTKDKVYGTNLGGLFLLERWMYEDWMVEKGGEDAWDEYTMSKNVGDGMYDILNEHFDSWFTEDDMDTLADAGVNMLRIPIGYWPFVSADEAGEPYKTASHLDKLSQIMKWSQDRHMYVLLTYTACLAARTTTSRVAATTRPTTTSKSPTGTAITTSSCRAKSCTRCLIGLTHNQASL